VSEQDEYVTDFIIALNSYIEQQLDESEIRGYVFARIVLELVFIRQVQKDMIWAIGSGLFVYLYISFHLRSIFLGTMAILMIGFSIPLTLVIYSVFFQVDYFATLHGLAIFIVLGIAADDVFVLIDAWKQSQVYKELGNDYQKRMAYTFRRASRAMAVTSSTTAVAFLANAMSDLMPIASFGIWVAILIPVNYFLVILFFPAVLMYWE